MAGLRSLTLPWGAGPTQPAILIGPDIPARIAVDPYANPVSAAMIYRAGLTVRHFQALAGDEYNMRLWSGCWDESLATGPADVIWHTEQRASPGGSPLEFLLAYGDYTRAPAAPNRTRIYFGSSTRVDTAGPVNILTTSTNPDYGDWRIDGRSMARGGVSGVSSQADSAPAPLAETSMGSVVVVYKAGRAYRARLFGRYNGNVAGYMWARLRRVSVAGPLLHLFGTFHIPAAGLGGGLPMNAECVILNATAADITENLILTANSNSGAATVTMLGSAESPYGVILTDCGSANDYAGFGPTL